MRVFFNAKQFYRSIFIQLQEFLAFLRNSLRLLLRKVKYDLSKSVQNKMWVFFNAKKFYRHRLLRFCTNLQGFSYANYLSLLLRKEMWAVSIFLTKFSLCDNIDID